MSYEKINFKNREVEKPLTFKKHVNDDGTITLEPKPGTIVEEGTPLLADHFNHMDDGIYKAHEEIDNLKLSGIERNKELVANLNSKKVSATTNDSLKTNIAKVKDIKLGSGNAVASDVLQGKTFSSSQGTDLTGTMPNHGSLSKTITTQGGIQKITPGYYESGEVTAQFNNLSPENIKLGVNVGGVKGSFYNAFNYGSIYKNSIRNSNLTEVFEFSLNDYITIYEKDGYQVHTRSFIMPDVLWYYSGSSYGVPDDERFGVGKGSKVPIHAITVSAAGSTVNLEYKLEGPELSMGWKKTKTDIGNWFFDDPNTYYGFVVGERYTFSVRNWRTDSSSSRSRQISELFFYMSLPETRSKRIYI